MVKYPRSYCENSHFLKSGILSLLCSVFALPRNTAYVMTRICVIMRAIRICACFGTSRSIRWDTARIVLKNGTFWAFFRFSKSGFLSLLCSNVAIWCAGWSYAPFRSYAFWLCIGTDLVQNRSSVAELCSFHWKPPWFFWCQKSGFLSLLCRASG